MITKSGSNVFHGSGNYFFQNANLASENKNASNEEFSTFDAAGTIGGPILRDKAWFFGSYRRVEREDDVTTLDTPQQFMRTVKNEQDQGYAKGTWTPTRNDSVSFTFLNDPTDISGRRDRNLTNARDRARVQGGDNYTFNYSRLQGDALIEAAYFMHNGDVTDLSAIREQSNTVVYRTADTRLLTDEQRGGFGQDLINQRDTEGVRGSVQYTFGAATPSRAAWSGSRTRTSGTRLSRRHTVLVLRHGLSLTAAEISAGGADGARLQRRRAQRFQRVDQLDQRVAESGGVLHGVRRERRRHDHVRRDGPATRVQLGRTQQRHCAATTGPSRARSARS